MMKNIQYILLYSTIIFTIVSCKQKDTRDSDDARFKVENCSWEENPDAVGCKIAVSYPVNDDIISNSVREWINEELGGTYPGNLNNSDSVITYYGMKRAEEIREMIEGFEDDIALKNSCYYLQIKKVFETTELVSFTSQIYQYSGGAHGGESIIGAVFRKSDGRRFGWDMFTDNGKEKLREMIKNNLKNNYFKVSSDEEFYGHIFDENASYVFPLPATAPIFNPNGVTFIYQQYELSAYAAGMPKCTIPYDSIAELCTSTAQSLIKSTNDHIAISQPYGTAF